MNDTREGFRRLHVEDWRQFESVDLEIHPRLTVLTGANASGKSTLLALLARHFNWARGYSSSPVRVKRGNAWHTLGRRRARRVLQQPGLWDTVGTLGYANGAETVISVPAVTDPNNRTQYDITLNSQQAVQGLFISSHRLASGNYTHVPTIPTSFMPPDQLFEQFANEARQRWAGGWSGRPPQMAMKEALISAAVFGTRGNDSVDFNQDAFDIWHGFQRIAQTLMPKSLGFEALRVRAPDVILQTSSDDFVIDEASGGISAILEIAWQLFLKSRVNPAMTVVMDEPENHLHPSLQRDLMPNLLQAFPLAQFVVATHSPFVVTAVEDSNVYVLDYNNERRVESRKLDYINKAASADETLRRVLGLDSTYPSWAIEEFDEIVSKYLAGSVSTERMRALRAELNNAGLVGQFPEAVERISDSVAEDSFE
ncbi:AAA family ATPase [Nocardioides panacis]|uniref:AAA family ATPase n=2 Tax=Nocardioides panacis TaxID=2849501 RepID=A0A975T003_9ACTN|nr:AAA family ATPase [Nocardioides panacis]